MAKIKTEDCNRRKPQADARALLQVAADSLRDVLAEDMGLGDVPLEVQAAIKSALNAIEEALRGTTSIGASNDPTVAPPSDGPTPHQGQFLAYIREYMIRNASGVAPRQVDFQRFFNLTPPSVNSMLNRLEQRGFIGRVPKQARAIELIINPDWIPPLDRPFKF
jgi:DNA-binding MarR family transcriptional regulator